MSETQAKRFADGRNFYEAPCCGINIGILEDVGRVECPACGSWLAQAGIGLSLVARVSATPPDYGRFYAIYRAADHDLWANCADRLTKKAPAVRPGL